MEKDLVRELRASRHSVSQIKGSLDSLQREKEHNYARKEQISRQIGELITKIRELRAKRDSLTVVVREKKERRNKCHETVKAESESINSLRAEIQKLMKARSIKAVPLKLKQHIEELDFKLQTEGYTFEKEKGVMKKIRELQAQLRNSEDIEKLIAQIKAKWQKIRELRKEADSLHADIGSLSAESQKLHEELLAVSGKVDALKPQRAAAAQKWMGLKEQISKLNSQLREKLQELGHAQAEMDKLDIQRIKSKEMEVEAKMKRGEKLTTEDLLVFQEGIKER